MNALSTPFTPTPVQIPAPQVWNPTPYHWNNDEFRILTEAGCFRDKFVMLINGEIIEMANPSPKHRRSVGKVDYMLKSIFNTNHWVRVQDGLETSPDTNPCPDVAVLNGTPWTTPDSGEEVLLVVEVSDTSFAYDRGTKAHIYAAKSIQDYWVIDINGRQLFRFRDPIADPSAPRGYRYATQTTLTDQDTFSPLATAHAIVPVVQLLP